VLFKVGSGGSGATVTEMLIALVAVKFGATKGVEASLTEGAKVVTLPPLVVLARTRVTVMVDGGRVSVVVRVV